MKKVLQIRWLWGIITAFYLLAYAFWVPSIFSTDIPAMVVVLAVTLIVGFALLADGLLRANELITGSPMPDLPFKRIWGFAGAVFMLGYLLVYIPPAGRVVDHWPLDMATTVLGGLVMLIYGIPEMVDVIKIAFQTQWLWSILGGFYLMVYVFWVPRLFSTQMPLMILMLVLTAISGLGILADGFFRASEIDKGPRMPDLPYERLWRFAGGVLLLGYLLIYLPPYGQILAVAHWPLDMAITVVSGSFMVAYAILDYHVKFWRS